MIFFLSTRKMRRGPLIAREALDLSFPYYPDITTTLLTGYLATVNDGSNPLLRSQQQMLQSGFKGVPYTV